MDSLDVNDQVQLLVTKSRPVALGPTIQLLYQGAGQAGRERKPESWLASSLMERKVAGLIHGLTFFESHDSDVFCTCAYLDLVGI